ncbi:hypothetical protein [Streptomyces sp. NPDC058656]|uniref:GH39 family glycosyl hydrolase n=1 Tax=unclassified Streptomyces TaxID=2593676 RepID=UPI003666866C
MKVLRKVVTCAVAMLIVSAGTVGSAPAAPADSADRPGTTIRADLARQGARIDDKYTDLTVWDYNGSWTTAADSMPSDYYAKHYPEVKRVQLMTATGGCYDGYPGCGSNRDLFKNPADRSTTTDYDFAPLLHAVRNVVRQGLQPYVVTGNVPIKFTAQPAISGSFGVNLRPPDDYKAYAAYIKALARAAISEFGAAEVRSWKWGVLTEYENGDWFKAADGTPQSTATAYFKLYDHTAKALTDAIGKGKVDIGAHSMTTQDGLWDERLFIDHVAKGRNHATGGIGAPIKFLSFSHYDDNPGEGPPPPHTFASNLATLKDRATAVGLHGIRFAVDEGRILRGSDDRELLPRSVAWSYQSALDASRYATMVNDDVSWFARWDVNTEGYFGTGTEVDPVETNLAKLTSRLGGSRVLATTTAGLPASEENQVGAVAGYDDKSDTLNVLVYNRSDDTSATTSERVTLDIANVTAAKHRPLSARQWRIDDEHANFWPTWNADMTARGMTSDSFDAPWSRDSWTVPRLVNEADRNYWYSRVPAYQKLAALKAEPAGARISGSKLVISANLPPQGVALYQITGVRPGR